MNKTVKIVLAVISGIVLSALFFCAGLAIGRNNYGLAGYGQTGMMSWGSRNSTFGNTMIGNGFNMIGGYQSWHAAAVKPLTIDQAKQAIESYLKGLNNADLELKEIMIFDNNGYARITEKSTGIGAMELLVYPSTLSVYPEYGPNMMWNLKYGLMNGAGGMMGARSGMMGGYGN